MPRNLPFQCWTRDWLYSPSTFFPLSHLPHRSVLNFLLRSLYGPTPHAERGASEILRGERDFPHQFLVAAAFSKSLEHQEVILFGAAFQPDDVSKPSAFEVHSKKQSAIRIR